MSKKLLSILAVMAVLAALISSNAFAQLKYEVGGKLGANFADMWGSDANKVFPDSDIRTGFSGAAFGGVTVNENFGARLELLYAQRGQKVNKIDFPDLEGEDVTVKLDYFEIALYGVGTYPVNEQFSVHGFAGPYIGFNTKAEAANSQTVDIDDNASTDFGIGVGVGGGFWPNEKVRIILELQYNVGFISVDDSTADLKLYNHGVALTAGVAVPIPVAQ